MGSRFRVNLFSSSKDGFPIFRETWIILRCLNERLNNLVKQECIPVGCVPAAHWPYGGGGSPCERGGVLPARGGVSLPGGVLPAGVVLPARGVSLPGGVLPARGGVLPPGEGGVLSAPVNRMTNRCKNITLATTSLRPVTRPNFCGYVCNWSSLLNCVILGYILNTQAVVYRTTVTNG